RPLPLLALLRTSVNLLSPRFRAWFGGPGPHRVNRPSWRQDTSSAIYCPIEAGLGFQVHKYSRGGKRVVATSKTVFIAFAKEDETTRNLFTGQRVNSSTPFEFIDMSVKQPYVTEW